MDDAARGLNLRLAARLAEGAGIGAQAASGLDDGEREKDGFPMDPEKQHTESGKRNVTS
ncbi:MAG TPA: hypothetical protein VEQ60_21680 [Longimicrobium sp.]|nr:hypothetical protein [Longimicrobium sp.]